jgi:hypothetical protein
VTRKVSVDSVADTSADDLLRFLYDFAFRQPSRWGWAVAGAFAAVPGWLSLVSLLEGKMVSCAVFTTMSVVILGLRFYMLHKMELSVFKERKRAADDAVLPFDIDG